MNCYIGIKLSEKQSKSQIINVLSGKKYFCFQNAG